jgi:small subunit ribosomal protein S20
LPNIASAEKRMRQAERRRLRNRTATSTARTFIHRAERLLVGGTAGEDADATVKLAIRALDKAAEKGIIHKNNAARRKSRLMRKLNAAKAGA